MASQRIVHYRGVTAAIDERRPLVRSGVLRILTYYNKANVRHFILCRLDLTNCTHRFPINTTFIRHY